MGIEPLLWVPIVSSLLALAMVVVLANIVLKSDPGNKVMQDISNQVQAGARAFLKREYIWIFSFVVVIAIAISVGLGPNGPKIAISFIGGAVFSALAGVIGMLIATKANCRTAHAAETGGLPRALNVAISGGAVMGLSVVGLALLGLVIFYIAFDGQSSIINGYAMGASLVALFARCGGGIYTKGADMGADLVGKVEAGIPEDDPRNAAVIADNVGDNVGDVAGLGADLMESYSESMIASMALTAGMSMAVGSNADALKVMPLVLAGVGIICSIIGIWYVKIFGKNNAQSALMTGTYVSAGLMAVASYFVVQQIGCDYTIGGVTYDIMGPWKATILGVLTGIAVGFTSEYFTSTKYKPVQNLAKNALSGPALVVTDGIAVGNQSTWPAVIVMAGAIIASYHVAGFYGIGMAAFGMLATTGMVVAVDSYGPIADNAGGIAEMAHMDPKVREITDNLDAVGNTTAAIGKGFAIGSAAFATVGLLSAYMQTIGLKAEEVSLLEPNVLAGLLFGGMLPFLFSSWLFRAVTSAAYKMIEEVRRQFKEIPGLMEGKASPDAARCVDISTQGAIQGMLLPGIMAISVPVIIYNIDALGPKALAGVLVGALVTGVMLGIQTANSGGALDNAKKYIEEGNLGGKGSDAHKAAVVGDTVGDPLKDTVGPSINILIKLMAVISLVIASGSV
jgi:K(+)-stimulated pyrophosphate-energized sodium pump